ncbi:MAG: lysyl-tRNA synthetase [Parcubacteria group bacterium]|nr:lysyl-tRNA synthetase [Parcubacteria group bacterium]
MFWVDRIAKEIQDTRAPKAGGKPLLIRDEKTLSGRIHIGSMRGVAIHGLVSEVLSEYGIPNEYQYELNDFDPFDTVQSYLDQERFTPYLGKPLYAVPSPVEGFENFAEYFAAEFIEVHKKSGFTPIYYHAYKDLYCAGKMDSYIRIALERASDIRRILKETSGSDKPEGWLPISVVCEECGKMMTTNASDFDGETVAYSCEKSPDGCVPCGHKGRVAPFKGAAKLFWKADWAVKWAVLGVDIEGGGKDHSTKGGSRDVANHIAREVFDITPPYDIPYEFFLVGGKKMSSSKGRGSSAREIAELFPSEVLRLALIGKDINQQIDVDPEGDSIPRWFDWYDELAELVRQGVADDFTRLYMLTQLPANQAEAAAPWQLRFGQVAFVVQMPHLSLEEEAERVKGSSLTDTEKVALTERAEYAKFWLSTYATEQFRFNLQETLPEGTLSDTQKAALVALTEYIEAEPRTGVEIHTKLHELKTTVPIPAKELFTALYHIFLARTSGPQVGWFLSVLPRDFVLKRLKEASSRL